MQSDWFSPATIVFLSYPYYPKIEGTGLEGKVEWDNIAQMLTSDAEAIWPENKRLAAS